MYVSDTYNMRDVLVIESQQKPKTRRQHNTHKKKQNETKRRPINTINRKRRREGRGAKKARTQEQHAREIPTLAGSQLTRRGV